MHPNLPITPVSFRPLPELLVDYDFCMLVNQIDYEPFGSRWDETRIELRGLVRYLMDFWEEHQSQSLEFLIMAVMYKLIEPPLSDNMWDRLSEVATWVDFVYFIIIEDKILRPRDCIFLLPEPMTDSD